MESGMTYPPALIATGPLKGVTSVEKQLQGRTVRTGEEQLFKARSRDQGSVKIIDIVRARLDTRSDSYMAEVPRSTTSWCVPTSACSPMASTPR